MKKITLLFAVLLMAVVSLGAQLVVDMPNVPAEVTIWPGTTNVPLATFSLTNPNTTDAIFLSEVEFSFSGAFDQNTIANAKLMCNGLQISETSNDLISGDGFNQVSLTILAGTTQEITLVVDFSINNQGRRICAGLNSPNQITAVNSSGATMIVSGNFPMFGTLFLILPSVISLYNAGPVSETIQMTDQAVELYQCLIEPVAAGITLQQVVITHFGLSGPDCAANLALYLNGSLIANTWEFNPSTEQATFLMDNVLLPAQINQLSMWGVLNQNLQTGNSICLGIENYNIQAISPAGVICSMEYLSPSDFPILGTTWWIEQQSDPSEQMHYLHVWPHSDNAQQVSDYYYYMQDSLYVFPGQLIRYDSSLQPIWENYDPNTVIGINFCMSLDPSFNNSGLVFETPPYCPNAGFLDNIGSVDTHTNTFGNMAYMSWVSDNYTGIDQCALVNVDISNHIQPTYEGDIWARLEIYNYSADLGLVTEVAFHNINVISNDAIKGDMSGDGIVESEDVLLGLQINSNQDLWNSEYNPTGQINIGRNEVVFTYPNLFNTWLINMWITNPNIPLLQGLGIGEPYNGTWPMLVPVTYSNTNNTVSVQTDGNCVSVLWQNSDGSFGSETIMFTENNRVLRWTNSIEPSESTISDRNEGLFQLPVGAELIDVQAAQIDYSPTSTDDPSIPVPTPTLNQNSPNPFNPTTSISYSLPKASAVTVEVYNSRGQLIRTLVNEAKSAGNYSIIWNGTDNNNRPVSSGIYFYKMKADSYISTKKMVLMK